MVFHFQTREMDCSDRFLKGRLLVVWVSDETLRDVFDIIYYVNWTIVRKIQSVRWLDGVFQGQHLPSLNANYVAINKDLETLQPQLYWLKLKICYDQGYNDIWVVTETK